MRDFVYFGGVWVDLGAVVAVEQGEWVNSLQDWRAVLVMSGGGRVPVGAMVQEALQKLK